MHPPFSSKMREAIPSQENLTSCGLKYVLAGKEELGEKCLTQQPQQRIQYAMSSDHDYVCISCAIYLPSPWSSDIWSNTGLETFVKYLWVLQYFRFSKLLHLKCHAKYQHVNKKKITNDIR
ncbi:hypothetical protein STEG23_017773, partial [Scotinomys teguina]